MDRPYRKTREIMESATRAVNAAKAINTPCQWCKSTSEQIDSLEYQKEQILALIAEWKSASTKLGSGLGNIVDHHVRELEAIVEGDK
jgi:hypothetical protein